MPILVRCSVVGLWRVSQRKGEGQQRGKSKDVELGCDVHFIERKSIPFIEYTVFYRRVKQASALSITVAPTVFFHYF